VADLAEFGDAEEFLQAAAVRTNAALDAPVSSSGPFPDLIYNHGGGGR
jgi:hypothetical protein